MNKLASVKILFVEDSEEDADLALRSFRKHGLAEHIKWIDDGQEALDYLLGEGAYAQQPPAFPNVVLLDLKLPKVSGLEILQRIKSDTVRKHIPIVVLTSSSQTIDIDKAYERGANSYIVKPVDFTKFSDTIRQLGLYWLELNTGK